MNFRREKPEKQGGKRHYKKPRSEFTEQQMASGYRGLFAALAGRIEVLNHRWRRWQDLALDMVPLSRPRVTIGIACVACSFEAVPIAMLRWTTSASSSCICIPHHTEVKGILWHPVCIPYLPIYQRQSISRGWWTGNWEILIGAENNRGGYLSTFDIYVNHQIR